MVTIGVVVLLVAGVFTADLVLENSGHTDVVVMGQTLSFDIWGLFVLGLAAGVLVVAGVQLLLHGLTRDRARQRVQRQRERDLAAMTRAVPPSAPRGPAAPSVSPAPSVSTAPSASTTAPQASRAPAAGPSRPVRATATPIAPVAAGTATPAPATTASVATGPVATAPITVGAPANPKAPAAAPGSDAGRDGVRRSAESGPAESRAAERVATPSGSRSDARPDAPGAGGVSSEGVQMRPRTNTHPRRGDRIVARVADLARRDRGDSADQNSATSADVRS
ncbi:hypothetical protein [Frankia sp. AiPa1]|uniref:hypothetical protein n=1 Tax=Frankia sp. AiPa1 TaxID=573492 RepID=UPI00202B6EAC|nr:hypothetical protein [Frankia sp. AiPa1]MCL9761875.1 hypothetical protein [Frankia sp. AiPa1]